MSPLCETFLTVDQLSAMEPFYPLQVFVCDSCFLVQVVAHVDGESIFGGEYAYFSSYSDSWLKHCEEYVADVCDRFVLDGDAQVVEIASNDGYLLQYFVQRGIKALGIEPADNVAAAAIEKGIPTIVKFFGESTARELVKDGVRADLLIGNNVLAHVPDLNDFVAGLCVQLAPRGVLTMEFPHLLNMIEKNQFDTIYQEHYCYLSLHAIAQVFEAHGLIVFDVEEIPTHGGSLRVFVRHADDDSKPVLPNVNTIHQREIARGLTNLKTYAAYGNRVVDTKNALLEFLIEARREGKRVAGYGAPGKGNTLLNYCGIRKDLLEFVVDRSPYKHGKFLPGTHIPIYTPEKIDQEQPDYVLILPWNLKEEITAQLAHIRDWGGKFVVPIPYLEVL
jgi:SAM-dependent methyltransferase